MSNPRIKSVAEGMITHYATIIGSESQDEKTIRKKLDAYYMRGKAFKILEKFEEAIADFNEVIKMMQTANVTSIFFEPYMVFGSRAESHFSLTQFEAALDDYNEAIRLEAKRESNTLYTYMDPMYYGLIESCKAIGRYNQALDVIEKYQKKLNLDSDLLADMIPANIIPNEIADIISYAENSIFSDAEKEQRLRKIKLKLIDLTCCQKKYSLATELIEKLAYKGLLGYFTGDQKRDAPCFFYRGKIYSLQNDYIGAIAALTKAIELEPKKGSYYIERAIAHKRQGDYLAGLKNKTKYKDYYEKANQDLIASLNNSEFYPSFDRIKGDSNTGSEKFKFPGLSRKLNDKRIYLQAEIALALNDYSGAAQLFNEILAQYQQSAIAPLNKSNVNSLNEALALDGFARIAYAKGEYEQCVEIYKKLISLDFIDNSKAASFHVTCANAYHQLGNDEIALQYLNKAVQLDVDSADAYWSCSVIYNILGDRKNAQIAHENTIRLNPTKYTNSLHDLCELGDDYFNENKYREALVTYNEAIESDPQFYKINISKGDAIEQDYPLLAEAYNKRSLAHEALGNDSQAAEDKKIAAKLNHTQPTVKALVSSTRRPARTAHKKEKNKLQIRTLELDDSDGQLFSSLSSSSSIFSPAEPQDKTSSKATSPSTPTTHKKR